MASFHAASGRAPENSCAGLQGCQRSGGGIRDPAAQGNSCGDVASACRPRQEAENRRRNDSILKQYCGNLAPELSAAATARPRRPVL
jgi:hypothetical protein